jgi:hypothetical protein
MLLLFKIANHLCKKAYNELAKKIKKKKLLNAAVLFKGAILFLIVSLIYFLFFSKLFPKLFPNKE